jgi:hypothetical protein
MNPADWHRRICLVIGALNWAISERRVRRLDLIEWADALRDVADEMERSAG